MSQQLPNESLPANLKLYGNVYLAISLIAAAFAVFYAVFAPEGYFPFLIGTSLAAIFQGLGVKLLFSFLAEISRSYFSGPEQEKQRDHTEYTGNLRPIADLGGIH